MTTKFHGMGVPYDVPCQVSTILALSSVCMQGKNYYPKVQVIECRYKDFKVEWLLGDE